MILHGNQFFDFLMNFCMGHTTAQCYFTACNGQYVTVTWYVGVMLRISQSHDTVVVCGRTVLLKSMKIALKVNLSTNSNHGRKSKEK